MSQKFKLMEIHEGKAIAEIPRLKRLGEKTGYEVWKSPVFYNPVMKLNRDLSVLAIQIFQGMLHAKIKICEPLAGSGIRGIRWAKEVRGIEAIVLNDANPYAYELTGRNVRANHLERKIKFYNRNANLLLQEFASERQRFDIIDLDPFGSPMPFLDSSIAAAKRLSLLAITATDTAPLCGVKRDACIRKYAAKPLRTSYTHEIAARILIGAAARVACIYEFGVTPLLTHSTDHYIRTYLEMRLSVKHANLSLKNLGFLYHCPKCQTRGLTNDWKIPDANCPTCAAKVEVAGPLWTGPLQSEPFCRKVEHEAQVRYPTGNKRLLTLLSTLVAEAGSPTLYYDLDELCDRLGTPNPPFKELFELLRSSGFQASRTHFKPKGLKTDAPLRRIEAAIRKLTSTSD
jgi:tRNA (guanine26-N2/guanine27-N2)-dimethyltransferase